MSWHALPVFGRWVSAAGAGAGDGAVDGALPPREVDEVLAGACGDEGKSETKKSSVCERNRFGRSGDS